MGNSFMYHKKRGKRKNNRKNLLKLKQFAKK